MRFLKKISKWFLLIFTMTFTCGLLFYYYLKITYTNVISKDDFNELVKDIKSTKSLPKEFYSLYEIEYPESLNNTYNLGLFKSLFLDKTINSPVTNVSKSYIIKAKKFERDHLFKRNEVTLSLNLDDKVTNKECLNWIVYKGYSIYNDKSIKEFSEGYYGKKIDNFNIEELAGVVALIKNPSLYNPYRRKDFFDTKVLMLSTIYQGQNKKQ